MKIILIMSKTISHKWNNKKPTAKMREEGKLE